MSWRPDLAVTLLLVGVLVELLCCLGLARMATVYDRIHLLGTAGTLGAPLLGSAVAVQAGLTPIGIKALLTAALLTASSPVLAHATARAAYLRQRRTPERVAG